jgi:hypothetical protein
MSGLGAMSQYVIQITWLIGRGYLDTSVEKLERGTC